MATGSDSKDSRMIFLMLTNQCNLRCSYCYEANKQTAEMALSTALDVLREDIRRNKESYDDFTILFHGGEPFLHFETMRTVAQTLWEEFEELSIGCIATTNGTVLTEEMKGWLRANRHRFIAILSLDGDRETHNLNRCNSYDRIDRAFFRHTWPHQPVKMTVAPDTLPKLYTNMMALYEEGFLVNPSLAAEVNWDLERDIPILERELDLLISFYLEHKEYAPCQLLDLSPEPFSPLNQRPPKRACGAGANTIVYDVKGNAYPCHTFVSDFNQQYDAAKIEPLFAALRNNREEALAEECKTCYAYPSCSPCYGLNYSKRGAMTALDKDQCAFTKVRIAAAAKMYSLMLLSSDPRSYLPLKDKTDTEMANMISGIMALQK